MYRGDSVPKSYNETIKDNSGRDVAYSVKIGNNVPHRGVNLAYVASTPISPEKNIALSGYPTTSSVSYSEKIMIPDSNMRLRSTDGDDLLPSDEITMTDEFTIPSSLIENPIPLYYKAALTANIKLNKDSLIPYPGGHVKNTVEFFASKPYDIQKHEKFIYIGNKISLKNQDGSPIDSRYKIIVIKDNLLEGKVYIYTNEQVTGVHATYESTSGRRTEIINSYPFFAIDSTLNTYLQANGTLKDISGFNTYSQQSYYSVKQEGEKYSIYVPTQNLIANSDTRHSFQFRYRVESNKHLRYDISKPGTINVGVVAINPNSQEDALDAMVALATRSGKPSFVTFNNPHPLVSTLDTTNNPKTQPKYWMINLDMPEEYFHDYDLIIIAGKGAASLSRYNSLFHAYLQSGGSIWIDNFGDRQEALILETNMTGGSNGQFIIGVEFSEFASASIQKRIQEDHLDALSRYYSIEEDRFGMLPLGYRDVSPLMSLSPTENANDWKTLIHYGDQQDNPALMYKRVFDRGLVFVSNCGILMGLISPRTGSNDFQLATNILMILGEDKWYTTPWIHDYVLHKDQVFNAEYGTTNGSYILESRPGSTAVNDTVAMKKLADSAEGFLEGYHPENYAVKNEYYYFHVEELNPQNMRYSSGSNEQMKTKKVELKSKRDPLKVYTTTSYGKPFNPTELGYSDSDIKLIDSTMDYSICLMSFTYAWSSQKQAYDKVYSTIANIGYDLEQEKMLLKINKSDGLKKIVDMPSSVPENGAGIAWADRSNIYYEAVLGHRDKQGVTTYQLLDKPITVTIQNTETGRIYTNIFGDACISYNELFDERNRGKIFVYANTSYQGLIATKRMFSVKSLKSAPIYPLFPDEIDERDQWYIRIANGIHKATDNTLLYKPSIVYEVNDYHEQLFMPREPFKEVKHETPIYLDYNQIKVGRTPMHVHTSIVTNEKLMPIGNNRFQSEHFVNWDRSSEIKIAIADNGTINNPATIIKANYTVDYENGIVAVNPSITLTANQFILATFGYSNISVERIQYANTTVKKAQLKPISIESNKTVYSVHKNCFATRFYTMSGKTETNITAPFTIDQESGILTIEKLMATPVYADYKYFEIYPIRISGVDINKGIIYTIDEIRLTDKIRVNYSYAERFYDYKGYYDGEQFIKLDLNPSVGHMSTQVYYDGGLKKYEEVPTSTLVDKPAYVYMVPSYTTTEYIAKIPTGLVEFKADGTVAKKIAKVTQNDIPDGAIMIGQRVNRNIIDNRALIDKLVFCGSTIDESASSILKQYTSSSASVRILTEEEAIMPVKGVVRNYNNTGFDYVICYIYNKFNVRHTYIRDELDKAVKNKNAILLAEVTMKHHMKPEDAVVMDSRVRGGGLIPELTKEKIQQGFSKSMYNQMMNFWDIGEWDGIPYQKNGITIITLPASIREKYSDESIKRIIEKYIALGVQFIVEYR